MKKPFTETKLFRILKTAQPVLSKVPFGVGELANNLLTKNTSPAGAVNRSQMVHSIVKMGVYAVLLYLVFSGRLTMEEAESAKEFITP